MFELKDNSKQHVVIDVILWALFAGIVVGDLYLYATYNDVSSPVKVLFVIFSIFLLLSVAIFTKKGRIAYAFVLEANIELRKVVWPAKDELVQVTLMVSATIGFISLILWGIDSAFSALISYIAA